MLPSTLVLSCTSYYVISVRRFRSLPASVFLLASGFIQIPPHDGHLCLRLTLPTAERVVVLHHLLPMPGTQRMTGTTAYAAIPADQFHRSRSSSKMTFLRPTFSFCRISIFLRKARRITERFSFLKCIFYYSTAACCVKAGQQLA